MLRRTFARLAALFVSATLLAVPAVHAADESPDSLIKRVSSEVLDNIKSDKSVQAGDMSKVMALVDSQIMPNVNFTRMTAAAVGRSWRQATPEQQKKLQDEFKTLLIRTYSGALAQHLGTHHHFSVGRCRTQWLDVDGLVFDLGQRTGVGANQQRFEFVL